MDAAVAGDGDAGALPGGKKSVIVVGSGYGAAVAALRMTEAGIPVTVFEMGRLWNTPASDGRIFCPPTMPDGRAMWFKDQTEAMITSLGPLSVAMEVPRQAGILDALGPETMRSFVGRGVGGGSLVNLAVYVEPIREVLARVLPDVDVGELYEKYYPRARKQLRATQVPADLIEADVYQYSRVGIAAAGSLGIDCMRVTSGYDYDYLRKEIAGTVTQSAAGGEGGFGNNHGKLSLDKTYFADAMGSGLLTIQALSQVTRVTRTRDGYVVRVRQIDVDGKALSETDHPCTHLFLCGGTFGTTELLVRARERGDLPDLNRAIGTEWGPNSDIFVPRANSLMNPTGVMQCTLPSSAFHTLDDDGKHVFSMIIPLPLGFESYLSFNIVMTENPEAGHFVYDSNSDKVELVWRAGQNDPAVKSARTIFDRMNRATGATYSDLLFSGPEIGDRATFHGLGGCPLGRATDGYGRVPAHAGLYIMDGSLLPVGIGANPSLTITALSERNIERILAEDFGV